MREGSALQQKREKLTELIEWLGKAETEIEGTAWDDPRRETCAEVKSAAEELQREIAGLERPAPTEQPKGWSVEALAAFEANAIRDALWLNPPSPTCGEGWRSASVTFLANLLEVSSGVKLTSRDDIGFPGDAGVLIWFGTLVWEYSEGGYTKALPILRKWYRDISWQEWQGWQPPAFSGDVKPAIGTAKAASDLGEPGTGVQPVEDENTKIPGLPRKLWDLSRQFLPDPLPQPTMQEARAMASTVSAGRLSQAWLSDQFGQCHYKPDRDLTTVLDLAELRQLDPRNETLRDTLASLGPDAPFLAYTCIGLVRQSGDTVHGVPIDALIGFLNWSPVTKSELRAMRGIVWRWLQIFCGLKVYGARRGYYTQPGSREKVETTSRDALIAILGEEVTRIDTGDPVPVTVTIQPGPWFRSLLGNDKAIPFYGNLHDLSPLPPGDPSGALARCIALALRQLWREGATKPRPYSFTRGPLLRLFGGDAILKATLDSGNPKRAREYWDKAITLLKQLGVIDSYSEISQIPLPRKGWVGPWLLQPLDIRPSPEARDVIDRIEQANGKRLTAIAAKSPRKSEAPVP